MSPYRTLKIVSRRKAITFRSCFRQETTMVQETFVPFVPHFVPCALCRNPVHDQSTEVLFGQWNKQFLISSPPKFEAIMANLKKPSENSD